jgi:LEA14-like dessication related protein
MEKTINERIKGKRSPNLLLYSLLILILVALIIIIITLKDINKVKVPDLIGRDINEAQQIVMQKKLGLKPGGRRESPSIPVDRILDQEPKANEKIKKNDTVIVMVSRGNKTNVPSLEGFKKEDASERLSDVGLIPGKIATQFSDSIPKDRIIKTDPGIGTEVDRNKPINIIVSKGPKPEMPPAPPPVPASFQRPNFEFKKLQVNEINPQGFTISTDLGMDNPNSIPGKIRGFYYKIDVDSIYLGDGTYYHEYDLLPSTQNTGVIKTNIKYDRLSKVAADLIQKGAMKYLIRGYYILETENGRSFEPIRTEGIFNLSDKMLPVLKTLFQFSDMKNK